MTGSISNYAQANYIVGQTLSLEAQYAQETTESASGLKAQTYSGIASDAQNVLNLKSEYARITAETTNAQTVQGAVNTTTSTLNNINTLLTSFQTNLSSGISQLSSADTASNLKTQAQQTLDELVSDLNTQYGGNYLFSGSATSTAPVNLSATGYNPAASPSTPSTAYYQGNDQTPSVEIADSVRLSYGVTADNPAFEQALRALSSIVNNTATSASLQSAYTLLQQAGQGVTDLYVQSAAKSNTIDQQVSANQASLSSLDTTISNDTQADLTQVNVDLSSMQTQLQSAFSSLSKLLGLNLSSYLK
jgi:flagellar hook-associated protein 3 FlgL